MKTLREAYGSEVKFTQALAVDVDSLNKINKLLGLPSIDFAKNEFSIPGGSIDVVGYTVKGQVIVYEHQDISGRADQTHVFKTKGYADVLKTKNCKVLATVLLCESIDQGYLDLFAKWREIYHRRPTQLGEFNIHAVKSQWTDEGVYEPSLFTETEIISTPDTVLDYYKEFVSVYGAEWAIQREEQNGNAVTLWHRIGELDNRYMAYVHTLQGSVKVGLHCLKDANDRDVEQMTRFMKAADGVFSFRKGNGRATIEASFPKNVEPELLADTTEKLKRSVRKALTSA